MGEAGNSSQTERLSWSEVQTVKSKFAVCDHELEPGLVARCSWITACGCLVAAGRSRGGWAGTREGGTWEHGESQLAWEGSHTQTGGWRETESGLGTGAWPAPSSWGPPCHHRGPKQAHHSDGGRAAEPERAPWGRRHLHLHGQEQGGQSRTSGEGSCLLESPNFTSDLRSILLTPPTVSCLHPGLDPPAQWETASPGHGFQRHPDHSQRTAERRGHLRVHWLQHVRHGPGHGHTARARYTIHFHTWPSHPWPSPIPTRTSDHFFIQLTVCEHLGVCLVLARL